MDQNNDDVDLCLHLAMEAEAFIKKLAWPDAAFYLEAALDLGTDNVEVLNGVYQNLFNIYCNHLAKYEKALKYSYCLLELARSGEYP